VGFISVRDGSRDAACPAVARWTYQLTDTYFVVSPPLHDGRGHALRESSPRLTTGCRSNRHMVDDTSAIATLAVDDFFNMTSFVQLSWASRGCRARIPDLSAAGRRLQLNLEHRRVGFGIAVQLRSSTSS